MLGHARGVQRQAAVVDPLHPGTGPAAHAHRLRFCCFSLVILRACHSVLCTCGHGYLFIPALPSCPIVGYTLSCAHRNERCDAWQLVSAANPISWHLDGCPSFIRLITYVA